MIQSCYVIECEVCKKVDFIKFASTESSARSMAEKRGWKTDGCISYCPQHIPVLV